MQERAGDHLAVGDAGAMVHELSAVLARERSRGFPAFSGTRAELAVLVRQPLVDRLLARVLSSRSATGVEVDLLEGARVAVTVTHRVLGLPVHARSVLELERELDARQRIVLRHEGNALWRTIRTVAATLGLLPPGVSFGAGTVEVDLRTLAARGGWDDLLPLVRRLVIHGPADGLFAIEADLEVADRSDVTAASTPSSSASTDRPAAQDAPPAPRSAPSLTASELLADLAGSRARVDLHVHEALANELLSLVRTHASTAPTPPSPARPPWTSFVRDARVRFEAGRLVLSVDLEVPGATTAGEGEEPR